MRRSATRCLRRSPRPRSRVLGRTIQSWLRGYAESWKKRMAIDEATVVGRARAFVAKVKPTTIPVPLEGYLDEVRGVFRVDPDLEPEESGWSFPSNNKYFISVNASDRLQRQRFTVCHEIAHLVLKVPSNHQASQWWSYSKRP